MDRDGLHRAMIAAAYTAGGVLRERLGRLTRIDKKGAIDLVTDADREAERRIIETLDGRYPGFDILAEESGRRESGSAHRWIIDPLDGTTNYAHELPFFSVSIACAENDAVIAGLVYNPVSGELFQAAAGEGATLNGHPIRVSETATVGDSLLVTGFPYHVAEIRDRVMGPFSRCLGAAQGVRRLGSAALDLCFVACGRFDGFWEAHLHPWDTAAGTLIVQEAGGTVTDFDNRPHQMEMPSILATNGRIHGEMLPLLSESEEIHD